MVPVSVVCDNSLINQLTKYPEIIYIGSLMAPCCVEYMLIPLGQINMYENLEMFIE